MARENKNRASFKKNFALGRFYSYSRIISRNYSAYPLNPPQQKSAAEQLLGKVLFKILAPFCFLSFPRQILSMENRKDLNGERRRKKIMNRPVLIRSEKPGQVASASYTRERSSTSFWKAA